MAREEIRVFRMRGEPLGDVPAGRNEAKTLRPGERHGGSHQFGTQAAPSLPGGHVGAVEIERAGAGRSVRQHRGARGGFPDEAVAVHVVSNPHPGA